MQQKVRFVTFIKYENFVFYFETLLKIITTMGVLPVVRRAKGR